LDKRTSINSSISSFYKEKEMADFRKMLYALAAVALLAVFSATASAQGLVCTDGGSTNQTVRKEGYTELLGDIVLKCSSASGFSTPGGSQVPQATIRVTIPTTTFTSKQTTISPPWSEALLMIEEPGAPLSPITTQTYCGQGGGDLNGVCNVTSTGNPDQTYDGTTSGGVWVRPNIFQGKQVSPNAIEFNGVPLDPPASNKLRTIRITNLRANIAGGPFDPDALVASQVEVFLSFEGAASVTLQSNKYTVGYVRNGLGPTTITPSSYTVCTSQSSSTARVVIQENSVFGSAWKARNHNNYFVNATNPTTALYTWSGTTTYPTTDIAQNIPGIRVFSEGGFYNPGFGTEHGINTAGQATTGTIITFNQNPTLSNVTITWPATATIYLGSTGSTSGIPTGFARRLTSATLPAGGAVQYEVGFADPFQVESLEINPTVTITPPATNGTVNLTGASNFSPNSANVPFTPPGALTAAIPRFAVKGDTTSGPIVSITNCNCSLLFPWVVSDNMWSTGIGISNTSMDPTNAPFAPPVGPVSGYAAIKQSGIVKLFLFGTNSASTPVQSLFGTSPTVPAGTSTSFLVSAVPGGFTGYAIAQSTFQYCHGVGFVFAPNMPSVSYLGLVMDQGLSLPRVTPVVGQDGMNQ
jgi:hypothetical protein